MRRLVAVLAFTCLAGGAVAQGDVITQRQEGLKRMGAHLEAIKPIADSRGDPRGQVARIDDMLAWFQGFPALFPAGSGTGNTKARPEVFSDTAGFQRANANAIERIEALKAAATSGDAGGFQTAFNALGPQGCGGCHRSYRAR